MSEVQHFKQAARTTGFMPLTNVLHLNRWSEHPTHKDECKLRRSCLPCIVQSPLRRQPQEQSHPRHPRFQLQELERSQLRRPCYQRYSQSKELQRWPKFSVRRLPSTLVTIEKAIALGSKQQHKQPTTTQKQPTTTNNNTKTTNNNSQMAKKKKQKMESKLIENVIMK